MKNIVRQVALLILIGTITTGFLVGCRERKENVTANPSDAEGVVTLIWYMSINPVAPDTDQVIAKLNEYTREKIGVEIDYKVIANPAYKEIMPNLIHAGEAFDICFTSNWNTDYWKMAGKDAFLDLTELLPKYAKETYEFIPQELWDAVKVKGGIYGVPSYKEMGWQGGILYNRDMAQAYGIDMSQINTLEEYTKVLEMVAEKSQDEGRDVIGVAGLTNAWAMAAPYETLTGNSDLPAAAAVSEFGNFQDMNGQVVFNQYSSQEYLKFCQMVRSWNEAGYLGGDPVSYDSDIANRDQEFQNGSLFSYFIEYAPGTAEQMSVSCGHEVGFVALMDPLFETQCATGGLLAISSASEYPEKALEFINLLNTDQYVGTLIRHGIEGEHYSAVGDSQVDRTMGGTQMSSGYDYTYGWQFGTPFNQKWDISYPDHLQQLFQEYNEAAIVAPHYGFTFDAQPVETQIAALLQVINQYAPLLETGSVDPKEYIPNFLADLQSKGVDVLLEEVNLQLSQFQSKG